MNGISLLVALAAVGIKVGWEPTPSGVDAYTIRIEALVIDTLRDGSAIESVVKPEERETLREFRVVVGPRSQQTQRQTSAAANEVDYGWSPNDAGGVEYYVQISLERLESLSRGLPLECIVHRDVPAIDKIFVFVGDAPLPRKLPLGTRSLSTPPRDLSSVSGPRDGNVAPVSGTETNLGAQRYGNGGYGAPGSTQVNVSDSNRGNSYSSPTSQGNVAGNQTYGPPASSNYGNPSPSSSSRYGQYGDNTLPVPPLDSNRMTEQRPNSNYNYARNQYASQQGSVPGPQTQQNYPPPSTQTAALPQQQYVSAPMPGPVQPQILPPSAAATNPTMDALAALVALQQQKLDDSSSSKSSDQEPEKKSQSSKPLILTTLALFASIGANAYLGWLAWSFFWRFRDAASDLSRARSNALPAGSLAGH